MKQKLLNIAIYVGLIFYSRNVTGQKIPALPAEIKPYVELIKFGNMDNYKPVVNYSVISKNIIQVSVIWNLNDSVKQNDLQINILPAFKPTFNWGPQLTPTANHIIAQHVFRTPALIVSSSQKQLTIIPDIDILKKGSRVDWYMDMDAPGNKLTIGMSESEIKEHVLFVRKSGAVFPPGKIELGFYILTSNDSTDIFDPFKKALSFFWQKWSSELYNSGEPLHHKNLEPYVKQTYEWAFESWKKSVWQEFELNGKDVGAPVFIVNVTQSPDYPEQPNEREFRSIWNQAWFSSLRSAEGLYRYARRKKDSAYMNYALKTKELALSFPQKKGFFYSVIATKMKTVDIDGKKYNRSEGWDTYYLEPALRCMHAVIQKIIPVGQWEDFETYWSCSRYGSLDLIGKKVERNNMFKQNTLSMYYTTQALYNCYEITHQQKFLDYGKRALDEMLMYQASWQPPYMYVNVLGGFGVMNGDGEWNDSRESLFAELIVKYGKLTKNKQYIQRGLAALRASFVMMYTPLNPRTKKQWEEKWKFFGSKDYGFMMENYGHGGETNPEGLGIGEFTIYDWGNGAASEAYNRMIDHFGESFILKN